MVQSQYEIVEKRASISAIVTTEFFQDQGEAGRGDFLLNALNRWAKQRGYVRIGEKNARIIQTTNDDEDADVLRSSNVQHWKIVASYRIMTPEEDSSR